MDKQTLGTLVSEKIFIIPDYQRGYSWESKQLTDLIQDIDALVEDETVKYHYTGTIVTYHRKGEKKTYNLEKVNVHDVVDGQQRLTSIILYLSVVIRLLVESGEGNYGDKRLKFIQDGGQNLLSLSEDSDNEIFRQLIETGKTERVLQTPHQRRLVSAIEKFEGHINNKVIDGPDKTKYLKELFDAITAQLVFTYYEIEEESEIGMTFELMNSRGKDLSTLELLKNYLMHWAFRNTEGQEKKSLTADINQAWKNVYNNLGRVSGGDEQCLRIAWIIFFDPAPKKWKSYSGFKDDKIIPLRNFDFKEKSEVKKIITNFSDILAKISYHYANIFTPKTNDLMFGEEEINWLLNIHRTDNIANFLALMIAARIHYENGKIELEQYIDLLKSLECFAFRVFLIEEKRGDAGKANFYRLAHELFGDASKIENVIQQIYGLICYYSPENSFTYEMESPQNWYYSRRRALKYILFSYEKHLLDTKSKGQNPKITWEQLSYESSLEHILPQNPETNSHWLEVWEDGDIDIYLHDIGNLVLTKDNSRYRNFDFAKKKGEPGKGYGYSNSDIRQERKIAAFEDWNKENLEIRRQELVNWVLSQWKASEAEDIPVVDEESDIDNDNGVQVETYDS